ATYLNVTPATSLPRHITGQFLARNHLPRRKRAELAAALADGTTTVSPLGVRQAAMLARVPALDVTRARRANGNGHTKPERNGETLAQHIIRSSLAERVEAARAVGVSLIWDTMIDPVIATEPAAE